MENNLNVFLKNYSETADENYYFEFDKSKSIKSQILSSEGTSHLINVRKVFTNNVYFGVNFTTYKHDKHPYISHWFRCKDRGYLENLVDSLDSFLNVKKNDELSVVNIDWINDYKNLNYLKQKHTFEPINNKTFDVYFAQDNQGYYNHCIFKFHDGGVWRGLYGAPISKYQKFALRNDIVIVNTEVPTSEQLKYFYEKAVISFSNVITEINTDYSDIKIFHR